MADNKNTLDEGGDICQVSQYRNGLNNKGCIYNRSKEGNCLSNR
jgi:hypothetical protein